MDFLVLVSLGLATYFIGQIFRLQQWRHIVATLLALVVLSAGTPNAWAVTDGPLEQEVSNPDNAPSANGGSADAGDIPSETVGRFVAAYLAVVELIESKEASLQRAETETESRQMQEEIQRQAIGLIKDHELTLQAYWELLGLANSDPEFRERVLAQVEEASL